MNFTQLKLALTQLLQSAPGLAQTEILPAFPAGMHLPLPGPAIVLGIDGVELTPASLGGFSSEQAGDLAAVTARFDFFAPGKDGPDLHILYEALCAALLDSGPAFGFSRIWCDPLAWDNAADSYRLSARALLRGRAKAGSPRQQEAAIVDFRVAVE